MAISVKSVRTPPENISLDKVLKLHSYVFFRILHSKIVNYEVFLPIEEFPVANFCKIRALIPRKYMVEQGIRVLN